MFLKHSLQTLFLINKTIFSSGGILSSIFVFIKIKKEIGEILADFDIKTEEDFMEAVRNLGLYEDLKAGVMEEYMLNDNQMEMLLDEVLEAVFCSNTSR